MTTRVLLTVDTELVWRHHQAGQDWRSNFALSYEAAGVGIPYQLRLLGEHGLKACFFVDPMPAAVYGLDPVRRMIDPILAAGQEVQLHLHPFWAHLEDAEAAGRTAELTAYDYDAQRALIVQARDLLTAAGAPDPIAFRSGSYAANADTVRALAELGFRYESSHNGSHHPRPSDIALDPRQIAPTPIAPGLVEIPVGQIEEGEGKLRHLQVCAVSFDELRGALKHADCENHPVTTLVSHSFELATRDGLRPNRLVQGRFQRLCRFLAGHRETMPTAWFADLGDIALDAAATPAPGQSVARLRRMAEQAWGTARYEKPASALAAAAGGTIASAGALTYVL